MVSPAFHGPRADVPHPGCKGRCWAWLCEEPAHLEKPHHRQTHPAAGGPLPPAGSGLQPARLQASRVRPGALATRPSQAGGLTEAQCPGSGPRERPADHVGQREFLFKRKVTEVKFAYRAANHLKLCNALAFSTFAGLCNHCLRPVPESFISKGNPLPHLQPLAAPGSLWRPPIDPCLSGPTCSA